MVVPKVEGARVESGVRPPAVEPGELHGLGRVTKVEPEGHGSPVMSDIMSGAQTMSQGGAKGWRRQGGADGISSPRQKQGIHVPRRSWRPEGSEQYSGANRKGAEELKGAGGLAGLGRGGGRGRLGGTSGDEGGLELGGTSSNGRL